MGKYRLKYASVGGAVTGKKPGDVITVTGDEETELLALGLLESEADYQKRQAVKAEAEAETEPEQTQDSGQVQALTTENGKLVEANAKLKTDLERVTGQVTQLKADAKKHADEVKTLKADVKAAQAERDAALAKIPKEGSTDAAGQPAGGE